MSKASDRARRNERLKVLCVLLVLAVAGLIWNHQSGGASGSGTSGPEAAAQAAEAAGFSSVSCSSQARDGQTFNCTGTARSCPTAASFTLNHTNGSYGVAGASESVAEYEQTLAASC